MAFDLQDLDIGTLRQTIADAEGQETALYAALGKKLFCSGDVSQCAGEMDAIRQLKARVSLAEAMLSEMEADKIVCSSCGKLLRSNARFCSACGTPVQAKKPEPTAPVCPVCGKTLRAGVLFCNSCGAKL